MSNTVLRFVALCAAFFTGGCVSLLPETAPPKPRYHIESVDLSNTGGDPITWSLAIDDPRATRVYDSVRIAVATGPGKVEFLSGAEWADRAPRLFLAALVQSFEDSGRILAVGDRAAMPLADVLLQIDLRKIQLNVMNGERRVEVVAYARLTNGQGTIHAAHRFNETVTTQSDQPDQVVAAFDRAFDTVISELAVWALDAGEAAMRTGS